MKIMMIIMMMLSLIMLSLNHPLSMGLILIIQTLITAMMVGYMLTSFLFSYIIMIIMLSGALVLFIYMASIASNEKFNFPIMNIIMYMILPFIFIMNTKFIFLNKTYNYLSMEELSLIKLFNTLTAQITLMMIMYLLLAMIAVSNIAKVTEGPLRINKYE